MRDDLILTLNLYLKLPFGKMHSRTPEVIRLANIIGRTASAVSMRLGNFASVDPYHQSRGVGGLPNGKRQVEPIWNEFINDKETLLFESEKLLAEKEANSIEIKYSDILSGIDHLFGESKIREVKTRVNQNVFRKIVISNYSGRCAISAIDIPDLLVASHILPWSKDEKERLNPENGLCLSSLYDKAFDKGLIGINEKYEILISHTLKLKKNTEYYQRFFSPLEFSKLLIPERYKPRKEFLQYHLDEVFDKK